MEETPKKEEVKLNEYEEREFRDGIALAEMKASTGFQVIKQRLESLAFHSWVDPRTIDTPDAEREWKWRELNAFHAANNARELLEYIESMISRAEFLGKVKSGEVSRKGMKI